MSKRVAEGGAQTFLLIWFGQLVSLIGSGLTGFALGVWVYLRTGSATQFALITLCASLPGILTSPLAGVLVDRWDRRLVMLLSDCVSGLCTLAFALLLFSGRLEIWHIYMTTGVSAAFGALHWPAYAAAVTMLVPPGQLGRASGMMQFAQAAARVFSPMVAGGLVGLLDIAGVLLIDLTTFLFALFTLLLVRVPAPSGRADVKGERNSLLKDAAYGWTYINERTARPVGSAHLLRGE
jgi:MFS family permease